MYLYALYKYSSSIQLYSPQIAWVTYVIVMTGLFPWNTRRGHWCTGKHYFRVHFSPLQWAKYEGEKRVLELVSQNIRSFNTFFQAILVITKYCMSFLIWWELLRLTRELHSMLPGVWCWNIHWHCPLLMPWLVTFELSHYLQIIYIDPLWSY